MVHGTMLYFTQELKNEKGKKKKNCCDGFM